MNEPLFKTFKGKFIAFIVGLALIAGITYFVLYYQDKSFRSVVVDDVTGSVIVEGGGKSGRLSVGEHLIDGDYVDVPTAASLTLCADTNKFLRADENTSFKIETGNIFTGNGIRIVMDSGSTLSTLTESLKEGEFWQVDTPNSTMAVRGTTFRVTVYKSGLEKTYTLLEVEKGSVKVNTHVMDGKKTVEEELFSVGECAIIKGDAEESVFMTDEEGNTKWTLDYDALPEDNIGRLVEILEDAGERLEPQPERPQRQPEPEQQEQQGEPEQQQEQQNEPEQQPEQQQEQQQETSGHTHTPGNWTVTDEASCTATGTRVQYCTECGEIVNTETIPMEEHQYTVEFSSDNCEQGGTNTYVCTVCGHTETGPAEARNHTFSSNTWEENGQVVFDCEVCHKSVFAGEYCANVGHDWWLAGTETEDGVTLRMWECTRCQGGVKTYNDEAMPDPHAAPEYY